MKRLTKIVPGLTLLALLFATPAAAEEIIMVCTHPDDEEREYVFKYVDTLSTPPKVYIRGDRGWSEWLKREEGSGRPITQEFLLRNRALYAIRHFTIGAEKADKKPKRRYYIVHKADFEFLKYRTTTWFVSPENMQLKKKLDLSRISYNCKKHDPN